MGIGGVETGVRDIAKYLNKKIKSDKNFEITCNQNINMINFRLRPHNSNIKNERGC